MKVAVVGSRTFNDYELVKKTLDQLHKIEPITLIVSGGAKGVDSFGEQWAKENNIETLIFLPDWKKFGKSAGFKRNVDIVSNAEAVIAFWDGVSHGTQHDITLAKEQGKKLKIIRYNSLCL